MCLLSFYREYLDKFLFATMQNPAKIHIIFVYVQKIEVQVEFIVQKFTFHLNKLVYRFQKFVYIIRFGEVFLRTGFH